MNGQNTVIPGWGQAVSDNGQVAFQIGQSSFIYNNGVSTSLGNVSGYETTYVQGVNDSGQAAATGGHVVIGDKGSRSEPLFFNGHFVAGGSGFLSQPLFFNGHTLVPLGTFGGPNGNAIAINNKGDITGEAMNASGDYVGFVSHNGGPLISLGTLPGGVPVSPRSINDSGQIVGYNGSPGLGAFLYQNGVLTNLNALLSPSASNINLVDAYFINNVGQILAKGIVKNPPSAQAQLFLLTPVGMPLPPSPDPLIPVLPSAVPEPSTLALFGLILTMMAALQWRSWTRSTREAVCARSHLRRGCTGYTAMSLSHCSPSTALSQ